MTRTDEKVRYLPESKNSALTPVSAASGVEQALRIMSKRLRAGQAIDAPRDIGWEGNLSSMREGRSFHEPQ